MNRVILMGRLTRDPEVRYTPGERSMAVARYTLAVDRRGRRNQDGNEQTADFINITDDADHGRNSPDEIVDHVVDRFDGV